MNNIIEATILNGKFKGEDVLSLYSDRYVVRVQTFAISCATRFCNDHQQRTNKFGKKTKNIAYSKALQ
jgi:hypothetical protein